MTRREQRLIWIALTPNAVFIAALLALAYVRLAAGNSAMPDGWTPFVVGLVAVIPTFSIGLANVLRLRQPH